MTTVRSRYSAVAIWLHWIIALMVIGNLAGGLLIDSVFPGKDPAATAAKMVVIGLHKSIGLTVILLTLVRIGWRLANPPPPLPGHMTATETVLARITHYGFYALLLAMPLSGWAMVSTGRTLYPIIWFGLFEVPHLPLPADLGGLFHESHEILGWVFIATILLHVAGAVKHRILDRDDVLARMLPCVRRRTA